MFVVLHRWSIVRYRCMLRRGITSSCQSAVTPRIVKRCCSRVFSCKQRYIKYPALYLYLYLNLSVYHNHDWVHWCVDGAAVMASDFRASGRRFGSRPGRNEVA